jgi:polyhydroxyalkanoate synthesis regulator phasin
VFRVTILSLAAREAAATGDENMSNADFDKINDATIARMIRELQSDLADMVEAGDITAEQANEWVNDKADQWMNGGQS